MANPIHRMNIETKDKRSQRKVADSTTKLDKTISQQPGCEDERDRKMAQKRRERSKAALPAETQLKKRDGFM